MLTGDIKRFFSGLATAVSALNKLSEAATLAFTTLLSIRVGLLDDTLLLEVGFMDTKQKIMQSSSVTMDIVIYYEVVIQYSDKVQYNFLIIRLQLELKQQVTSLQKK